MKAKDKLSALSRLALVRAKVERAKQNLRDMVSGMEQFHGYEPGRNRYIHPRTPEEGRLRCFHIPFDCLAAAGDVVNNLRGSLDHLVYQLALTHDENCPLKSLEKTAFPIGKDIASYKDVRRRVEKVISHGAIKFIDALKPYKGGNERLFLLSELTNISKHRMLLTVGEIVICHADWVGEMSSSTTFMYKVNDPHFDGIYGQPQLKGYVQLPGEESITDPDISGTDAMLPTLYLLVAYIDDVIKEFLPFLEPHDDLSAV